MPVLFRRPPPTLAERVLGRRRARRLRRRLAYVAFGSGAGLLRPTVRRAALAVTSVVTMAAMLALYR